MGKRNRPGIKEQLWSMDYIYIILVATLIRICTQVQTISLPLYIQSLGGSKSVAGLSMTFYTIAALVLRPLVGNMLEKRGRWRILLVGTAVYGLSTLAYGFVLSIPTLILLRVVHGLAFSAHSTAISTMVTDVLPESRMTEGIAYFGMMGTISIAIAPSLALYVIDGFSYSALFYLTAAIAGVALIFGLFIRSEKKRMEKLAKHGLLESGQARKETGEMAKWEKLFERNALLPSAIVLFACFATSTVNVFLPTFAKTFDIKNIGLFFTIQAVTLASSRLFVGKISKKLGAASVIHISLVLLAATLSAIFFVRSLPVLLLLAAIFGAGNGLLLPELNAMAIVRTPPDRRGIASATFYIAMDLGIGAGAAVWGLVADLTGVQWVFLTAGGFPIVALVLFLAVRRQWIGKEGLVPENGIKGFDLPE